MVDKNYSERACCGIAGTCTVPIPNPAPTRDFSNGEIGAIGGVAAAVLITVCAFICCNQLRNNPFEVSVRQAKKVAVPDDNGVGGDFEHPPELNHEQPPPQALFDGIRKGLRLLNELDETHRALTEVDVELARIRLENLKRNSTRSSSDE